jgi:hypothetical protein
MFVDGFHSSIIGAILGICFKIFIYNYIIFSHTHCFTFFYSVQLEKSCFVYRCLLSFGKEGFIDNIAKAFLILAIFFISPVLISTPIAQITLSLIYRWSLKSTALIWSPLLWVVISARGTGIAKIDLSYVRDWQFYAIMRYYSLFVITLFAAKMWLFFNWNSVAAERIGYHRTERFTFTLRHTSFLHGRLLLS